MKQVFKPLYYWDAGRHAVAREPHRFLTKDGLIGRAFMLHPFKLSSADAAKAFWQVPCVQGVSEWVLSDVEGALACGVCRRVKQGRGRIHIVAVIIAHWG